MVLITKWAQKGVEYLKDDYAHMIYDTRISSLEVYPVLCENTFMGKYTPDRRMVRLQQVCASL